MMPIDLTLMNSDAKTATAGSGGLSTDTINSDPMLQKAAVKNENPIASHKDLAATFEASAVSFFATAPAISGVVRNRRKLKRNVKKETAREPTETAESCWVPSCPTSIAEIALMMGSSSMAAKAGVETFQISLSCSLDSKPLHGPLELELSIGA
jgi:hypothetical protein